ncbi:U-actitoxin-Avd8e [Exaiptasia diaphana]|uniref:Uncharacterized protein n=1 Tax=Exaiptasia diaphana TaxID=2652724 RepID=A0A913WUB7_EXADI|nr:U-actitoxin-Avd8e [Exaiptasia diaphana]KXJ17813.1 hypothetical protein AC249_AIPGENE23836 [Exaiptasia diaphana]
MDSLRILVVLMAAICLLCQVSADPLLDEILAEYELKRDYDANPDCSDQYKQNICGKIITQLHCMKTKSRMGKFAKANCRRFCGYC